MAYRMTAATNSVKGAAVSHKIKAMRNIHGDSDEFGDAVDSCQAMYPLRAKARPNKFHATLVKGNIVLMPEMRFWTFFNLDSGK